MGRSIVVTEEMRELVRQETLKGVSAAELADRLGTCKRTIVRIRDKAGIKQSPGRRLTEQERALIATAVEDEWPLMEIVETLGRDLSTVAKNVHRMLPGQHYRQGQRTGRMLGPRHFQIAVDLGLPVH